MARIEPNYFGMQLGQAIDSGASHISEALQRRYERQRREALTQEQQAKADQSADENKAMMYAAQGIKFDPANPSIAQSQLIEEHMAQASRKRGAENMDTQYRQAQINALNAKGGPDAMKSPAGYRPTAEGNLEMIPGGPADLKAQAEMTKTKESQATQDERIANTKMRVDKAIERLGFFTTGLGADTLSKIGGTDARSLKGDLDTIKANLGFDRLTQMRNESKTGGALGNVSDRELTLLTAAAASLDQGMKRKDLEANLLQIKEILDKAKSRPMTEVPVQDMGWSAEKEQRLQELRAKHGGR